MFDYDNSVIFMPLEAAQLYFQLENRASQLEIMVDDPDDRVWAYRFDLQPLVGDVGQLIDWQQSNSQFFTALKVERNVMFLILSLIIMVAAFNIISGHDHAGEGQAAGHRDPADHGGHPRLGHAGLLPERRRDRRHRHDRRLPPRRGGFAANIETIQGWLEFFTGADLFAAEIYFLSHLPTRIETFDVVSVVLMSLGLSLLATLYPSWRAARLDPVEALRYE